MKTVTIQTEIKVSDCGRYCDDGCRFFLEPDELFFPEAHCCAFLDNRKNAVKLKQNIIGFKRCRQCIAAENKAGKQ